MQYRGNPSHYQRLSQVRVCPNPVPFCRAFAEPPAEACGSFDATTTLEKRDEHVQREQTCCTPPWEAYAMIASHAPPYLFTFLGLFSPTPLASSGVCALLGGGTGFLGGLIYFDSKSINVDSRLYLLFVPSFAHFKEQ